MSDASTTFFTDEIAAHDAYKLCSGLIVPRPSGGSARSADGVANLALFVLPDRNDPMRCLLRLRRRR